MAEPECFVMREHVVNDAVPFDRTRGNENVCPWERFLTRKREHSWRRAAQRAKVDGRVRPPKRRARATMTERNANLEVARDPATQRRRNILDVAIRVFAENGFGHADVQVIADEVGVGKGTVYRNFGTKEKLFLAAADEGMRQLQDAIFASVSGIEDDIEFIRAACRSYVRFFQQRPTLVEILIQERAQFRNSIPATHLVYRERNRGVFEQRIQRAVDAGVLRPVSARDTATALGNLLYGTVVCGCLSGSVRQLTRTVEASLELFLNGILAERVAPTDSG